MKTEQIIALDYNTYEDARAMVDRLGDAVDWFKVGLELFVGAGPQIVSYIKERNKKVFLDLKFHDIPNTAAKASVAALGYGVDMLNMHAQGGVEMMKTTAELVNEACAKQNIKRPLLLAVTVLTSLDMDHLTRYGIAAENTGDYVVRLASFTKEAGLDGVVSSAKETPLIKAALGSSFITVTPGIRPAGTDVNDQKRVVTPADAKAMGTDYIVVGRPVTHAVDPVRAALAIKEELS